MLGVRAVITALSAAIAIALLASGHVFVGLLLLLLVGARVVMISQMMRRRAMVREFRTRRRARIVDARSRWR
jgi:hypothetical protein